MTRGTIWVALVMYTGGTVLWMEGRSPRGRRSIWSLGCAAFAAHVLLAYHFFYGWNHATALHETAQQTEAMTGFRSGSGLYLNFVFGLVWTGIVLRWWWSPVTLRIPPAGGWMACWHGFALFMILNGTVVFGKGPVRWLGGVACLLIIVAWWRHRMRARAIVSP
ncbi:MAG: hypothetical protein ACKV19_17210 [Verrucomicrobiales bacterium]